MTYSTPLQAGSLNRLVTFQQRGTTVDTFGQQSETWTTVLTARASVEPMSGSELVAAGAQINETMVTIVIRYRPSITSAMRVTYQAAVYNILSVVDDYARHRKLTLMCQQGLTRG
jgi:SPP1 family predicted phage head-tail adaptor